MKVSELLKILEGKEDFEIKLYDTTNTNEGRPIGKDYNLELQDVGYSEKIILLGKANE